MTVKIKRRVGFYELIVGRAGSRQSYFQAEKILGGGKGWTLKQWYGPAAGWSQPETYRTLGEIKEHLRFLYSGY